MKTLNLSVLALFAVLISLGQLRAQTAQVQSEALSIDGYVEEVPPTDNELEQIKSEINRQKKTIILNKEKTKKFKELSRTTEKLSDTTEDYLDEKKDSQATIDAFNKKIDCLMKENNADPECDQYASSRRDVVKTQQAAVVEAPVEPKEQKEEQKVKLFPYIGISSINTSNESLESGLNIGLNVEADVTERVSVGAGINYMSFETTDFANAYRGFYATNWVGQYNNFYGGGREIEYTNLAFDLYGKYFITKSQRFRPYVGGGLSYNRTQMGYTDQRAFQTNPAVFGGPGVNQFGNEEVITSHFKINLRGGTEIAFNETFGMNLELSYARGISGNVSSDNANPFNAPDQQRLQEFNDDLIEADIMSIFAGMIVNF